MKNGVMSAMERREHAFNRLSSTDSSRKGAREPQVPTEENIKHPPLKVL